MHRHFSRNYRIISVMFWSFPYLLWQAFGNWSGFLVGVIVAVVLTAMFNGLFQANRGQMVASVRQPSAQQKEAETETYQRGYRAEEYVSREESPRYQTEAFQSQIEEMQVSYPEMPPMELWEKHHPR